MSKTSIEQLAQEIEALEEEDGEVIPEATLSHEDWEDYYKEVERIRHAQELAPDAGRLVLR